MIEPDLDGLPRLPRTGFLRDLPGSEPDLPRVGRSKTKGQCKVAEGARSGKGGGTGLTSGILRPSLRVLVPKGIFLSFCLVVMDLGKRTACRGCAGRWVGQARPSIYELLRRPVCERGGVSNRHAAPAGGPPLSGRRSPMTEVSPVSAWLDFDPWAKFLVSGDAFGIAAKRSRDR